jgi:hypothetical protein
VTVMVVTSTVYAMLPRSEIGKNCYDVIADYVGVSFLAFAVCGVLHLSERAIRSIAHWKRVTHEPHQSFLLGEEAVRWFSGWAELSGVVAGLSR